MQMDSKLQTDALDLYYGKFHALLSVSLSIRSRTITAIIGPSGCGKSTLLRCFNRMNDLVKGVRIAGRVFLDGVDILAPATDVSRLRRRIGMVFQRPNPFPLSIFDNVTYGRRIHGETRRSRLVPVVESSLRATGLWDELKDRLDASALELSPEQQQRLCISRVVAVEPEVLLMDEPCSALDPIATGGIEDLMRDLAQRYAIVIVTHNMQQAARVAAETAFMLLGELVEFGPTARVFENPKDRRTEDYVSGRYG
jgi:phosphate transport system ATP-binding protein